MSGFTVDPASFAPVAAQLRQAGAALQTAWEPVRGASQAVQFGAGTDVVSPLIQTSLAGAVALVESCIASSAKSLQGYADGLERMGRTYGDAEQNNAALLRAE
jgi:hypothetical protein